MTQIPLIKGDAIDGVQVDYRDSLPINYIAVEKQILNAKGYMNPYDGLTLLTAGEGVDRGANYHDNIDFEDHYRVSGTSLISVSATGTTAVLGAITGTDQASMPYSFRTQAIIANGKMWLYDTVGGFREVTDEHLGNPIDGVWINEVYVLTDGEFLLHTDILDEEAIDPLKFATSAYAPDQTLGVSKSDDNKLIAWNRYSHEYFRFTDTDPTTFLFTREPSRAQKVGIVAPHAKTETEKGWYIAGGRKDDDVGIHLVNLGSAQRISTDEIEKILKVYSEPDLVDMRMETRTEDKVTLVIIHLPDETLVFNETISLTLGLAHAWTVLQSTGGINYRAINLVNDPRRSGDRWIAGDKLTSNIAYLDSTTFGQYEAVIPGRLDTPFLKLETASIDELEIETIPGYTLLAGEKVFISQTVNGVDYGPEVELGYGEPGETAQRFILRRLGDVADWVGFRFRIDSTERMPFAFLNIEFG